MPADITFKLFLREFRRYKEDKVKDLPGFKRIMDAFEKKYSREMNSNVNPEYLKRLREKEKDLFNKLYFEDMITCLDELNKKGKV